MTKQPRPPHLRVVPAPSHPAPILIPGQEQAAPPRGLIAGSADDPRMKEAMRLVQAFLAIEDDAGRKALVTLAERLVSKDWAGQVRQG
jgi:hypothetical protein